MIMENGYLIIEVILFIALAIFLVKPFLASGGEKFIRLVTERPDGKTVKHIKPIDIPPDGPLDGRKDPDDALMASKQKPLKPLEGSNEQTIDPLPPPEIPPLTPEDLKDLEEKVAENPSEVDPDHQKRKIASKYATLDPETHIKELEALMQRLRLPEEIIQRDSYQIAKDIAKPQTEIAKALEELAEVLTSIGTLAGANLGRLHSLPVLESNKQIQRKWRMIGQTEALLTGHIKSYALLLKFLGI
jgi:hypothetical protein